MSEADPFAFLPPAVRAEYTLLRALSDGRVCGVRRLMYHWTLHVDIDWSGYADSFCYATRYGAESALKAWDGAGDPAGWHRNPRTGRRRDLATGTEWVAW